MPLMHPDCRWMVFFLRVYSQSLSTVSSSDKSRKKSWLRMRDMRANSSVSTACLLNISYTLVRLQCSSCANHVTVCVFGCLSSSAFIIFPTWLIFFWNCVMCHSRPRCDIMNTADIKKAQDDVPLILSEASPNALSEINSPFLRLAWISVFPLWGMDIRQAEASFDCSFLLIIFWRNFG